MALDFQSINQQVKSLGEGAVQRQADLRARRQQARDLLAQFANRQAELRRKVEAALQFDPTLRCALPVEGSPELLNGAFDLPELPAQVAVIAADGSQINPDRHAEVNYCLINTGTVAMELGADRAPQTRIESRLFYGDELLTAHGTLTEARVALMRDLAERKALVQLAEATQVRPVITFTDGPLELWGSRDPQEAGEYQKSLADYKGVLSRLAEAGAVTAGYVDKPGAELVVRLLEIALLTGEELPHIRDKRLLRGVSDRFLFSSLPSGARSAIFALQSGSAENYTGQLALHFFYLNAGTEHHSWLARVEIPAWVAWSQSSVDALQAVLVAQCRILGNRPYPYLLHRAHETALVKMEEKEQVTQMIALELRRRGVELDETSNKQFAKNLGAKGRYGR